MTFLDDMVNLSDFLDRVAKVPVSFRNSTLGFNAQGDRRLEFKFEGFSSFVVLDLAYIARSEEFNDILLRSRTDFGTVPILKVLCQVA